MKDALNRFLPTQRPQVFYSHFHIPLKSVEIQITRKSVQMEMGNARAWHVFIAVMVIVFSVCYAQNVTDAANYINNLESQVMEISRNAVINFMSSCDLVASCQGNCSRHACTPVQADEGYECKRVAENYNCYNMDGSLGCQNIRVSMTKSFIRLPTGPNNLTNEANATICSQRMLDATFKNISYSHNGLNLTSWVYFGSVEGVQRNFPGRDLPTNNCTFELRKRPWYMGVTAVKKDVIVLLDTGNSMGDNLPGDLLVTVAISKLSASFSIVNEFLDTLTYGDRVTVITFNNSGAKIVLLPITVTANGATSVQPLKTALQNSVSFDDTQGDSNLTSAFVLANQTFVGTNALKVILTITDGQIMPVDSGTTANTDNVFDFIRSLNVLVQIFSFDRPPAGAGTQLQKIACDCFGTYEKITTVKNPLWTLRSYFGILARIRLTASNNMPSWTRPYQDSGSLGMIITVVYPAFADNYTLIGVAGIDVLLEELGSITQSDFTSVLINHSNSDVISDLVPPRLPCPFALSTANQCSNVTAPPNVLCPHTDTSGLSFTQRICNCSGVCLASVVDRKGSLTPGQIGGIGIGVSISVILGFAILMILIYRKRKSQTGRKIARPFSEKPSSDSLMKFKSDSASLSRTPGRSLRANSLGWGSQARQSLIEYTQEELSAATDNWSSDSELGRGAHGLVFKGILSDGTLVAIKKPTRDVTQDAWDTFATELELLSKLNHKRLVRLLGYCKEEIILVYEFMKNGTLADWLHSPNADTVLGWESRLRIAMGAAKGLEYLHEYAMPKTYHGDVKPANILLDHEWEAHVSDFGLSIWSKDDKNPYLMASRVGGTFGYLDPEFVSSGQVTFASDVYSFGIVLLELMTGRPVVVEFENIKDWVAHYEDDDALEDVLDKSLETPDYSVDVLVEIVRIALRCTERRKQDRPKMKEVASSLDQAWNFWVRAQECIPEEPAIEPR